MSVNYAQSDTKKASLDSEFGYNKAVDWFGQELVESLTKYVRGPKKGMPKGFIVWKRVVRGGWVKTFEGGYVENRVNSIIERKLHKLESSQHGNFVGEEIAWKESIDRIAETRKRMKKEVDESLRRAFDVRSELEELILSLDTNREDIAKLVQNQIQMWNKKIFDYLEQYDKYK